MVEIVASVIWLEVKLLGQREIQKIRNGRSRKWHLRPMSSDGCLIKTRSHTSLGSSTHLPSVAEFIPVTKRTTVRLRHHIDLQRRQNRRHLRNDLSFVKHRLPRLNASDSSGDSQSMTKMVDCYLLGCRKKDIKDEDVRSVQETLWSLQYSIPGVVTAMFGFIPSCTNKDGQPFDFGVFYRFSNETGFRKFVDHSRFADIQSSSLEKICTDWCILVIEQEVSNDLETIFRKGQRFEEGYDHLLLTRSMETQSIESMEFLSVLGDVAKQSETGAICSSVGTVLEASCGDYRGMLVLASHVGSIEGIEAFEQSPPVKQLWQPNGNGLMKAELSLTIQLPES